MNDPEQQPAQQTQDTGAAGGQQADTPAEKPKPTPAARGPEEAFERCRDTLDNMMGSDHQRRDVLRRLVEHVEGRA